MSTFDRLFAMKDLSALKSPRPALATQQQQSIIDKPIKPTSTYVPASLFSPIPKIKQSQLSNSNNQDSIQSRMAKPIPFRGGPTDYLLGGNPFLVPSENHNPQDSNNMKTIHNIDSIKKSSISSSYISNLHDAIKASASLELSSTIVKDTSSFEEFIQKDLDGELPSPLNLSKTIETKNIETKLSIERIKPIINDNPKITTDHIPQEPKSSVIVPSLDTSSKNDIVPHVILREWRIQRVPNDPEITKHSSTDYPLWIIIEGIRKNENSSTKQLWHSSLIVDRIDDRTLLTSTGKYYYIDGEMDRRAWIDAELSTFIIDAFQNGFPHNWKHILRPCLQIERVGRSIPRKEKIRTSIEPLETHSEKDLIKRKVATEKPQKIVKRKRISLETTSLTKSLTPASQLPLPVSRSGRKIVPPLAFWMNEYAKRSRDGQLYIIKANQANSLRLS